METPYGGSTRSGDRGGGVKRKSYHIKSAVFARGKKGGKVPGKGKGKGRAAIYLTVRDTLHDRVARDREPEREGGQKEAKYK